MTGPYRAPRGQTTHCCLPGDVPAELSKVTASASHPDLLGGWDAWAEAAAPTPAAEGRTLALEASSPQGAHRAWHFAPLHCQAALDPPERGEGREQQQVPVPALVQAPLAHTGVGLQLRVSTHAPSASPVHGTPSRHFLPTSSPRHCPPKDSWGTGGVLRVCAVVASQGDTLAVGAQSCAVRHSVDACPSRAS